MSLESQLDLVGAVLIFLGGIIPAYLSFKLRGGIAKITVALTAFIIVHGVYHILRMQAMESIADGIFEPASVLVLIAFGATYLVVSISNGRKDKIERQGRHDD